MSDAEEGLKSRFLALAQALGIEGAVDDVFAVLHSRYREAHRAYHHLGHVADCLDGFDSMLDLAREPLQVELAIWFHDIVYEPLSKTNEEDSALLFVELMAPRGLSPDCCRKVAELIFSTAHVAAPQGSDASLLHDVDLSILGSDATRYDAYSRSVRQEYSGFNEEAYRLGRLQFLRRTLGMERIFCTALGRQRYEVLARRNLEREARRLEHG